MKEDFQFINYALSKKEHYRFIPKEEETQPKSNPVMYCFFPFCHPSLKGNDIFPKNRNNGIISRRLWLSTTLNQHPPGYLGNAFFSPLALIQGLSC
jgi:hypothetical protein